MTPHPINHIEVGEAVTLQNLSVFPLSLSRQEGPAYIPSSVAIEQHGLVVTEISDGGSVPDLMVENPSAHRVLLLDGEELRGAKQNRIINTTLLLAARSRTVIPVSCTESGRWDYVSPTFSVAKTVMPVKARRRKTRSVSESLRKDQSYRSNQGEVWNEVDELHQKIGSHSKTSAMSEAYEKVRQELADAVESIPLQPGQAGLLAMIDGRPAGLDLFSREDAYAELHSQLLQSYAMEALANMRSRIYQKKDTAADPIEADADTLQAQAFLEQCAAIKGESFKSVSLGIDWRFVKEPIVGSGLEFDDTWIHMAYFVDDRETSAGETEQRMARMSRRSHYRRP